MAWEENSRICLHMQLIAILSRIGVDVENGHVVFLLLYDKENASTVKVNVVKQLVRDMEFEI